MKYSKHKNPNLDAWFAKKRKNPVFPGSKKKRKKKKKKKKIEKVGTFSIRKYRTTIPVVDSNYVMEYGLTWDQIYRISKNRFDHNRMPKIEISMNKNADLRDEFSSYCGQKKTIKNWLFYV
ncbi:hypothetical protein V9T40_005087 [Parthenolecanium corni]|uniref:Uncharacterized protein n=1 Tax=Parthenolecanium corni TaxID=536013 RepID=A0AAN9TF99_9HEMI